MSDFWTNKKIDIWWRWLIGSYVVTISSRWLVFPWLQAKHRVCRFIMTVSLLKSVQNFLGSWGKERWKVSTPGCSISGFLPENLGVLVMDVIAEIRRRFHVDNAVKFNKIQFFFKPSAIRFFRQLAVAAHVCVVYTTSKTHQGH